MSIKQNIKDLQNFVSTLPVLGDIFKPKPKVATIRMSGVIAEAQGRKATINFQRYSRLLDEAFALNNLKAVALIINSPGGSPAQSELIGKHIRTLAAEKDVPVYAFVEDVAASGGYWLACAADQIYAAETSIIGSIGVISAGFGLKDIAERHGITRRVYTSGKDKSFLDPFLDESPADVKRLKSIQRDLHDSFIAWVKQCRGQRITASDKEIFEGAFWLADTAKGYGLIDDIGSIAPVIKDKFGEEIKFVDFSPEKGLLSSLIGAESKLINGALDAIEHRAIWGRYGL